MIAALLLGATLIGGVSNETVALAPFAEEQRRAFDALKIGERVEVREQAVDGCNTCGVVYEKVSDNEVRYVTTTGCTLMACAPPQWPAMRYK